MLICHGQQKATTRRASIAIFYFKSASYWGHHGFIPTYLTERIILKNPGYERLRTLTTVDLTKQGLAFLLIGRPCG
jgi:hypothetical protein